VPFAIIGGVAYLLTRTIPDFASESFRLDEAPATAVAPASGIVAA
jgi:hypothetical protein